MTYRERLFAQWDDETYQSFVGRVVEHLRSYKAVFVVGNGGSQSTAQHLVLHLRENGIFAVDAMADNAYLTMLSNDFSYDGAALKYWKVFAESHSRPLLFTISGSGDSENVLTTLFWARTKNIYSVGMYGFSGGAASKVTSLALNLKSEDYGIIEDVHLSIVHMIAEALRARP